MGRTSSRLKRFLVLLIILGLAIAGFKLLLSTRPSAPAIAAKETAWPVQASRLEPGAYAPVITLFGRIKATNTTTLSAALNADVLDVTVEDAQSVSQNQLLVRLDDQDARLLLRQREAEIREAQALLRSEQIHYNNNLQALALEQEMLTLAEAELARAKRLKQSQLAAQNRIDEARQVVVQRQLNLAQRQLAVDDHQARQAQLQSQLSRLEVLRESAQHELDRTRITAPYPGIITEVLISPGERVRPGDPLVRLFARDSLQLRAQIPARYREGLRQVLSNGIRLSARPVNASSTAAGFTLARLSRDIKNGNSSVEGIFLIEGDASSLVQGQVLELRLPLPEVGGTLSLPVEALYGQDRIYLIEDGRLKSHSVQHLGIRYTQSGGQQVIIRASQLPAGAMVLTTQLPNAIDGLKVDIIPAS